MRHSKFPKLWLLLALVAVGIPACAQTPSTVTGHEPKVEPEAEVDYTSLREAWRWTPEGGARTAALDPAGAWIAYVPWDQSKTVVASLASGEIVGEVLAEPPYRRPGTLAFSPVGGRLAIGGSGTVDVYEVPSMERLRRFDELENPHGGHTYPTLAFSPEGNVLVATQGPAAHFLGVASGETLGTLVAGEYGIGQVAFSRDGGFLLTYGGNQALKAWLVADFRAPPQEAARVLSEGRHIGAFGFSPDGSTLAVADRDGEILLFDPMSGVRTGGFPYGEAWVPSLVYTPDGGKLVTGGGDGDVRVWDAGSGELLGSYPFGAITPRAVLSSDGSILLVQVHRGDVVALRGR